LTKFLLSANLNHHIVVIQKRDKNRKREKRQMALYKLHGEDGGLKFDDLVAASPIVSQVGLPTVIGEVVGVSHFLSFLKINGLAEDAESEQVLTGKIPEDLLALNQELVSGFQAGYPVAVRSSAKSERGGTGIYQTVFIVPREGRDENLGLLWEAERKVYASEFEPDAKAYRRKHSSPFGIAAMIQPVVGQHFGNYFCPLLAGSAYVSYEGKRLIRACVGLGVKAVDAKALVINKILPVLEDLKYYLKELGKIVVVNIESGQLEEIDMPRELMDNLGVEPLVKLWEALRLLEPSGNHYLEWATPDANPDNLQVLQAAPFEDKTPTPIKVGTGNRVILTEGTDIVNHGVKNCQVIVRAGLMGWTADNVSLLEWLNGILRDYLLIVPQTGFSAAGPLCGASDEEVPALSYAHFSNAAALLEIQGRVEGNVRAGTPTIDHTHGHGGQHFQQICDREDILFIGAETDLEPLHQLESCAEFDRCIRVWQVPVEVVNDKTTGKGTIYICGQAVAPEYSLAEIQSFGDILWDTARYIEKGGNEDLAAAFYNACHTLPAGGDIVGFDPFAVEQDILEEKGKPTIIAYLRTVLEQGEIVVDPHCFDWEGSGLQTYLRQLVMRLQLEEARDMDPPGLDK